jgi:hypothetical protein
MRVVLRELAHAHDAVQRAVRLVAVAAAEFGHAQRQVAVALMPCLKISTCAGQFIGFSAIQSASPLITGPSSSVLGTSSGMTNMFSRYLPQWPDCSHWRASITCGVLTST